MGKLCIIKNDLPQSKCNIDMLWIEERTSLLKYRLKESRKMFVKNFVITKLINTELIIELSRNQESKHEIYEISEICSNLTVKTQEHQKLL